MSSVNKRTNCLNNLFDNGDGFVLLNLIVFKIVIQRHLEGLNHKPNILWFFLIFTRLHNFIDILIGSDFKALFLLEDLFVLFDNGSEIVGLELVLVEDSAVAAQVLGLFFLMEPIYFVDWISLDNGLWPLDDHFIFLGPHM